MNLRIELDLSAHCIRTEARRIYEECLRQCLKLPEDQLDAMEEKIEALKDFLETIDFGDLRSRHSALAGGSEESATLIVEGCKDFVVHVQGEIIVPKQKQTKKR